MTEVSADGRAEKSAARETWVDVAKGATILLVVLHHSVQYLGDVGTTWPLLSAANDALKTFRMPLFFFSSGLFFGKNLSRSFDFLMRRKVGPNLYLTGLWVVLQGLFFWVFPWTVPTFGRWEDIALAFVWPTTVMWYVYALALYGLAAWVLARLPFALQWVIIAAVSGPFASGFLATPSWAWDSILSNLLFFFAAVHFPSTAFRLAKLPVHWAVVAVAAWFFIVGSAFLLDLGIASPLRVPASLAGIVAAIILARAAAPTRLGKAFAWLGRHTLPIFTLHLFVIHGFAYYLRRADRGFIGWEPIVIVGTASIAVAASLLLWLALRDVRGLFRPPM